MRILDIIEKKRDNIELSIEEIDYFLDEIKENRVPDYQLSAFLMAVYFNGMSDAEMIEFTKKMRDSGDVIKFENIDKFLVDKHSTGGVGDKVTIVLAPIIAALGMGTTKLSGRGLGHTGGTIDKFESINGFKFSTTKEDMQKIFNKTGIGLMGTSENIVPLDKKIYALRDVTATVGSIPLIASSIMSKKLAIFSNVIILDVKVGDGAFMKNKEIAQKLANAMISIGNGLNRTTYAILTNMDEPLGHNIGNSIEVIEGIEALKGNMSEDLKEVVYTIAGLALLAKKEVNSIKEAYPLIDNVINSGKALEKFSEFIVESGGNSEIIMNYNLLPTAKYEYSVKAEKEGYISKIKAEEIGRAAVILGAGRATKEDDLDFGAGIIVLKKVGDYVKKGDTLAKILYNKDNVIESATEYVLDSYIIQDENVEKQKAILDIIK